METKKVKKLLADKFGWKNVSVRTERVSDGVWLYIKVKGRPEDEDLAPLRIKGLISQNLEIQPLRRKSDAGWDVICEPISIEVEPIGHKLAKSREVKDKINRNEVDAYICTLSGFRRVKRINEDWSFVCERNTMPGTPFDPVFVRPKQEEQNA